MQIIPVKFSSTATEQPVKSIENPEQFLREQYSNPFSFGAHNLLCYGNYKLMGWEYNFRPYLKRYIIRQYGQYSNRYAPNKTLLRKAIPDKIDEIIEVK